MSEGKLSEFVVDVYFGVFLIVLGIVILCLSWFSLGGHEAPPLVIKTLLSFVAGFPMLVGFLMIRGAIKEYKK